MGVLKVIMQYDGSGFCGFELQPGQRSVRSELQKALNKLYKKPVKFINASRTDSGVHALGQVISYQPPFQIPLDRLPTALNSLLPDDIRVLSAKQQGKFHARHDAKLKTYEYLIYNDEPMPVHLRKLAWQVKPKLNLAAMRKAAKYLVGKHDFSSFCAAGSDDRDHVREIRSLVIGYWSLVIWRGVRYRVISLRVTGNGFLYKMVRNMVGTLVEVGQGKRVPAGIKTILRARDRRAAGKTAPAQGLCLLQIDY